MTLTDEELDRDWKPNGRRPQSTVAQMFSQELMDIFRIDNSVADLDEKVDKRKQQINSQTSELEAIEARIREMEQRLKGQMKPGNPSASTSNTAAGQLNNQSAPPPPAKDYPADQNRAREQQHKYAGSRPGTARQGQPAVPGGLPPTPAGSEGESAPFVLPLRIASRPSGAQGPSHPSASSTRPGVYPPHTPSHTKESRGTGGDSDSVKSLSESASFADYVIVPGPDGDRERDA